MPIAHWEIDYNDLKVPRSSSSSIVVVHHRSPPPSPDRQMDGELGRGAFGIVYKAQWRLQDVAVKQVAFKVRRDDVAVAPVLPRPPQTSPCRR